MPPLFLESLFFFQSELDLVCVNLHIRGTAILDLVCARSVDVCFCNEGLLSNMFSVNTKIDGCGVPRQDQESRT